MNHRFYILRKVTGSVIALMLAIVGGIIYHQNALAAPQVNYFLIDGAKTSAAAPYEVTVGATPTLSWQVTDFGSSTNITLSCQASDHWSGSKPGEGTETRPATDTSSPGDYTYTLLCQSGGGVFGQTVSTVYMHVIASPAPAPTSPLASQPTVAPQTKKVAPNTSAPATKDPTPTINAAPTSTASSELPQSPKKMTQNQTSRTTSRAEIVNTIVNWIFWLLVALGLVILLINLFFPTFFRLVKKSLLGLWWILRLPFRSKKLPVTKGKKKSSNKKKRSDKKRR